MPEEVVSTEVAEVEPIEPKTEEVASEEPKEEVVVPKKKTAQERIDELTRKRRDAERDAEYWRKKALEKEPAPVETPAIPPRPKLDQFESTEAYEDALLAWNDRQKEIKAQAEKQHTEQQTALQTFQERAQKVRQEYDDFDEVVEQPIFSQHMREALLYAENGPAVAYHLGTNPSEAARIRNLPPTVQLLELGKLETKLLLAKQTKKVSAAPPPPTPVGMAGGGEVDESKLSTADWIKLDNQRRIDRIKKQYER